MTKLRNKPICVILVIVIMATCFAGCERKNQYYGSDVGCYTVAVNSVLGLVNLFDSQTVLMDEDSYGRQMFVYAGVSIASSTSGLLVVFITQKSYERYVYYYPDDCFLICGEIVSGYTSDEKMKSDAMAMLSATDLQALQDENDWGKPLDEARCDKKVISCSNKEPSVKESSKQALYSAVRNTSSLGQVERLIYLTSDDYNRYIYFTRLCDANGEYTSGLIVMFYPDGHFNYVQITDFLHYQDAMKEFKIKNNWNEPLT